MNNNSKKEKWAVFICAFIFIVMATLYIHVLSIDFQQSTKDSLIEISKQSAVTVENRIQDNFAKLTAISDMLNARNINNEDTFTTLEVISQRNTFKRIGIIDLQGQAKSSDGTTFYAGDREYYASALQGTPTMSKMLVDRTDQLNIHVYAVPIYNDYEDNQVIAVLFATNSTENLSNNLNIFSFNGAGYSEICDKDGDIVLTSNHVDAPKDIQNIQEFNFSESFSIDEFQEKTSGVIDFKNKEKKEYYLSYIKIDVNDWYLFSIVPKNVASAKISQFMVIAIATWVIVAGICVGLMIIMYRSRRENQKKLLEFAYNDPLTNHYNFNKFSSVCQGYKDLDKYSIVEFDVKGFRWFNEIYGQDKGDDLLKTILQCLDQMITTNELCTRIDSDHFTILLKSQDKADITSRLMQLKQDVHMAFSKHHITSTYYFHFGVFHIDKTNDIRGCLEKAEYAKNQTSLLDKDSIIFYTKEMYDGALEAIKLSDELHEAMEHHDLKVFIQPKVSLHDNTILHGEALVRWQHPKLGLIPPDKFIPIFEKNGLLQQLDLYVLENVLKTLENWNTEIGKITIAINVSRAYVFNAGYINTIKSLFDKYSVNPSQIEIEITETVVFDHKEELIVIIKELQSLGLSIALDDFGSGYSSLNMLKDIPIDIIKLDQGFFSRDKENKTRSEIIIDEVITLSKRLGIITVAEGVEVKEQNDYLKAIGCDYIQGYYYYKPMPLKEFEKLLHEKNK